MDSNKCIHCGEDCGKHPVVWDDLKFCCNGCKAVYEILNQNKLYTYYELEENPGIKVETREFGQKYAFLDNEEIKEKLYDFKEGDTRRVKFYIPSIHCSSCIWLLENLQKLNKSIIQSHVNFVKKELSVLFNEQKMSLRELVELLASIHYVPQITLEDIDKKNTKKSNKKLIYKLGVAAFCFGNTMLFSFPEYMPGSEFMEDEYKSFFAYMNFILAIPVLFYSGNDYWLSALKNLRKRIINIDVPITIGMFSIFIQSSWEIFSGFGSGYMDSLSGFVFFLLIGKWYQAKTYQALSFDRDYKSYFPIAVTVIQDSKEKSVELKNIKVNDILLIRNQELIPTDSILASDEANIDYSFVTGESSPVKKTKGEFIYAGGKQLGGTIKLKVQNEVSQSRLTQLWNQNQHNYKTDTKSLDSIIDKVSKIFTIVVLSISFATGIAWLFINPEKALFAFTSVLIVACPCALALSMPFTFGGFMQVYGKNGLYLKAGDVIEKLSKITTIVFDKTGTLTYTGKSEIQCISQTIPNEIEIKKIVSLLRNSTHPISVSLYNYFNKSDFFVVEAFNEIAGKGIVANVGGDIVKIGSKQFVLNSTRNSESENTMIYISINKKVFIYSLQNNYRDDIDKVLSHLSKNFNLHLISGDSIKSNSILKRYFNNNMYFNQSPEDKLNYIKKLKSQGEEVLMIGDGLNDAGALQESDVGISIADNIYHFSPACDAILTAEKFKKLPVYLKLSKESIKVIKSSFLLSFIYNVGGLYFAVTGVLTPIIAAILMPASSVTIVAYVTFMGNFIARKHLSKSNR